ncbi:ABC transporter substrate-binding protein [Candidatus Puniceispirillum sp.]|nr:ABC transporter substrate-binding protein [Candidatus Puniceispirillum sp.]
MNKGLVAVLAALVVGAVAFMLTSEKPSEEKKEATAPVADEGEQITIAVPSFLTGGAAGPFGIPAMNGAKMVVDAINKGKLPAPYNTKGFGGATASLIELDEGGGATKQVAEYRNLVEKRNVDAVVGYISSGNCQALAPIAEELKQFTIFATCGTPRIFEEAPRQYVFRTMSHATADNTAAAMYVKENFPGMKGYTGIQQNYAWGQDSWRDFDLTLKQIMPNSKASDNVQFPKIFAGQYGSEISAMSLDSADLVHSSFWGGDLEAFIFQGAARGLFAKKTGVLTVGGTAAYRLGKKLPNGIVLGARGPYGILVRDRDSVLNQWFINTYKNLYGTYPSGPAYQYGQAILAAKIAYDKAGSDPSSEQLAGALRGITFESFSTKVEMSLGGGHQAVTENGYGITKYDEVNGENIVTDVKFYPASCIMPPDGVGSVEWIKGGMKGAKC